jgi:hypothetical protein
VKNEAQGLKLKAERKNRIEQRKREFYEIWL